MENGYSRLIFSNGEIIGAIIVIIGAVMVGNALTNLTGLMYDKVVEKREERKQRKYIDKLWENAAKAAEKEA